MRAEIEAFHVIAVGRAEVFEPPVGIGNCDDIALVVRAIMAVPVVIVNVGNTVDASAGMAIDFGLGVNFAANGGFGYVAAVGVHVVMVFIGVLAGALRACGWSERNGRRECQS